MIPRRLGALSNRWATRVSRSITLRAKSVPRKEARRPQSELTRSQVAKDHEKYVSRKGQHYMTGMQMLVKLPVLLRQCDKDRGFDTEGFVSGYRGTPVGSLDLQLMRMEKLMKEMKITFIPGINEEIAASSVQGTQQACVLQDKTVDGVFAIWYAKGPGIDRSGDAIKHANYAGTTKRGGVLCLAGDDPACKSSSLSHQSDFNFRDMNVPILAPGSVAELLEYGVYGIQLSRFSGCWAAMRVTSLMVDSATNVNFDKLCYETSDPPLTDFAMPNGGLHLRLRDDWISQDVRMYKHKLKAVEAFAYHNKWDKVVWGDRKGGKLGIVTAGTIAYDVIEAMQAMGIDEQKACELGISVYKIALVWPVDSLSLSHFASSKSAVLVVEEKRSFLESQLKDILFNSPVRPKVIGKQDLEGKILLPEEVDLSLLHISNAIRRALRLLSDETVEVPPSLLMLPPQQQLANVGMKRSPYYCSGCPHNSSTVLPGGSFALGGIGCHTLAMFMDRIKFFSPMGGEGANWIGMSPYLKSKHVFVNVGDGSFIHSTSMAVRACVAAGVNVTFKVLHNGTVAMTGGQPNDTGVRADPEVMGEQLLAEGVKQVTIIADKPREHKRSSLRVLPRQELMAEQLRLSQVEGVTAIIFDQECATERRRRRVRKQEEMKRRMFIHEEVCEGCGDCGVQSNCVGLAPKETMLGRKRMIDQSNCNADYSCNKGFCPSFVAVAGGKPRNLEDRALRRLKLSDFPVPEPCSSSTSLAPGQVHSILLFGVGGCGIITAGAIIGRAAHAAGLRVNVLHQVGLSQKNGSVNSMIKVARPDEHASEFSLLSVRAGTRAVDAVIALDLISASYPASLASIGPSTRVLCNTHAIMPGSFTRDRDLSFPTEDMLLGITQRAGESNVTSSEMYALCEDLIGDGGKVNVFSLGFAYQKGMLPLPRHRLLEGIRETGVAVDLNLAAFEWGRVAAAESKKLEEALYGESGREEVVEDRQDPEKVRRDRKQRLRSYQDEALATKYEQAVEAMEEAEGRASSRVKSLTLAVATNYYKLLAYKDEIEVARLLSDGRLQEEIDKRLEGPYSMTFFLSPPFLSPRDKVTGLPMKIALPAWLVLPCFKLIAALRPLRRSFLNPFFFNPRRRRNLQMLAEYEKDMRLVLERLRAIEDEQVQDQMSAGRGRLLQLAEELLQVPSLVRGFGHVQDKAWEKANERRKELLERITRT